MSYYTVYGLYDLMNHNVYFGYTRYSLAERFRIHYYNLENWRHTNSHLQTVYDKEGDVFEIKVVALAHSKHDAKIIEAALIRANPACYNIIHNSARTIELRGRYDR